MTHANRITAYHVLPKEQESKCHFDVLQRQRGSVQPTLQKKKHAKVYSIAISESYQKLIEFVLFKKLTFTVPLFSQEYV